MVISRMVMVLAATVAAALLAGPVLADVTVVDLRCEYRPEPLGIDVPNPRLSWKLESDTRGQVQSAYHVMVAASPEALGGGEKLCWDSGKVDSDQSIHIPFGGRALQSKQRYWWKVRVWDRRGRASQWSEPSWFEMAMLDPVDQVKARWISSPQMQITEKPVPMGPMLWHPRPEVTGDVFFRAEFEIAEASAVHGGLLAITAEKGYEAYINGAKAGQGEDWLTVERHMLGGGTHPRAGRNVIAVKVSPGAICGALMAGLRVTFYGGQIVYPELHWTCSTEAGETWMDPAYDAQGWIEAAAISSHRYQPIGVPVQQYDGPRRSLMLRKEFTLAGEVRTARAYVTGLGCYETCINGTRVGQDILTPGWTQYEKRIQYQSYDVTDLLEPGVNAIGAVLGNGWWSGGLGWTGAAMHAAPGENLRLLMQLEVEYTDGSREVVVTDDSWQVRFSPILEDTLYHGETYDARLDQPGWNTAGFEAGDWQSAVACDGPPASYLCAQKEPAIRRTAQLRAKKITSPSEGVYVYDFGQNHSGRCRLRVEAPAGTVIRIRHSELLDPDGNINNINYRSARATDTYICRGTGIEQWEPSFTYRGFRYAELVGYPGVADEDSLVSQVLHNEAGWAGRFECSSDLLNRINENIRWGQISNMHSVPTDCPQRDERLGWTGDAQAFGPTACWNMQMATFFTKWMYDVVDSQRSDGAATGVCPIIVLSDSDAGRSAWADAIAIVPWVMYQFYGDTHILEQHYQGIKQWVDYMRANLGETGLYEKPTWGDWVPVVTTPTEPVSAAYGYYSTVLLSRMAGILGREADAHEYRALAQRMADAYNARYFDPAINGYKNATQTANLLPLAFGITEPEHRQAVAETIARDVAAQGNHHTTGFLGTPLILLELTRYGYSDLAWQIISQTEYPSLGYMVSQGATTIWERWNSDQMGPQMNSRNHFAFGAMGQWLYEGLAGINLDPEKPGFKHFTIKPVAYGNLEWVDAAYPSMYGEIQSRWKRNDRHFDMSVAIPVNTSATVHVPATAVELVTEGGRPAIDRDQIHFVGMQDDYAVFTLGSGRYDFQSSIE